MDLVRIVLAHQPYAGLERLPVLLASLRFQLVRQQLVNTSSRRAHQSYRDHCALDGELFPSLAGAFGTKFYCGRAVFLLQPEMVKLFSGEGVDLWYALSTGIPEIQDIGIQKAWRGVESLLNYNNLYEIPWTPELEAKIVSAYRLASYSLEFAPPDEKLRLLGFLGIDLGPLQSVYYLEGRIRRILRGEIMVDKRDDVEALFKTLYRRNSDLTEFFQEDPSTLVPLVLNSGYLYPIIHSGLDRDKIIRLAFLGARKELFPYIGEYPVQNPVGADLRNIPITKDFVRRVKEILKNPPVFFTSDMLATYRVVAGEIVRDAPVNAKILVNNGYVEMWNPNHPAVSLQDLVLYDPAPYQDELGISEAECYRRGIAN